jgi:hypothetical protein
MGPTRALINSQVGRKLNRKMTIVVWAVVRLMSPQRFTVTSTQFRTKQDNDHREEDPEDGLQSCMAARLSQPCT